MGQVVAERLPGLKALADHRGQRIVADIVTGVRTRAVPAELGAIVDELVVNAVKFSPERSLIRVSVEADNMSRSALLVVADQGPGIPESERKEVVKSGVPRSPRRRDARNRARAPSRIRDLGVVTRVSAPARRDRRQDG